MIYHSPTKFLIAGADRPLLGDQHGWPSAASERRSESVLHQSTIVRWDGPRSVPGFRQRPARQAQAVASTHTEGSWTVHSHADLPRGRGIGVAAGRQSVPDSRRQVSEDDVVVGAASHLLRLLHTITWVFHPCSLLEVTTCLENLEMSKNLTTVKMS